MRNDELFSPACPDEHAQKLVRAYALRGLLDDRRSYEPGKLLAMQYGIYEAWLAALHESRPGFSCDFYEWLARGGDSAFIFRPGDLVKFNGRYCVVAGRCTHDINWGSQWRIMEGEVARTDWPQQLTALDIKEADGSIRCVHGTDDRLEPADIPPELFALACGKAKDCPMLKGGRDDE